MILAYDGARYKGWQRLRNQELTLQETIESAIKDLTRYEVEIHASGRTDAGVHARGQVVHMKLPVCLPADFIIKLNEMLPEDIRVLKIELASLEFHSRYDAKAKTYKYYVDTNEKPDVFKRKYSCHYPKMLNLEQMKVAAKALIGRHDFSSFTDDKTEGKRKVREIYRIDIKEKEGILEFSYYGNGFLQHMVRIITGTLLEVGVGIKQPEQIEQILKAKERVQAGFRAPAKGLFLEKVEY